MFSNHWTLCMIIWTFNTVGTWAIKWHQWVFLNYIHVRDKRTQASQHHWFLAAYLDNITDQWTMCSRRYNSYERSQVSTVDSIHILMYWIDCRDYWTLSKNLSSVFYAGGSVFIRYVCLLRLAECLVSILNSLLSSLLKKIQFLGTVSPRDLYLKIWFVIHRDPQGNSLFYLYSWLNCSILNLLFTNFKVLLIHI